MKFSLVVAAVDRVKEFSNLLESLHNQSIQDFEVIFVDQSGSDIFDKLVEQFKKTHPITHLRSDVRNVRHASHKGAQVARGEIITFPDDDCVYETDTLANVDRHFHQNPSLGFLTGSVVSLDGKATAMGRWLSKSQFLDERSIWMGLIEFNFFMKRNLYDVVGGFDIKVGVGVGVRFGSSEGQDLALRMFAVGATGYHDRALVVRHMDKPLTLNTERASAYGLGMGYVMRKNRAPFGLFVKMLMRSLGGVVISTVSGKFMLARYYAATFKGRLCGYLSPEARGSTNLSGVKQ